jgi:hypothetical protein
LRRTAEEGPIGAVARMADAAGVSMSRLAFDYARLAIGPGRIMPSDFEALRLYDSDLWGGVDLGTVVGAARGRRLVQVANFRRDCLVLANDRLAANAYLAAHGLPVVPTLAVYHAGVAAPGHALLRTRDELRQFLVSHAGRPLIAQPAEAGSARLLFVDPDRDPTPQIDRLLDHVGDAPGVSWLIQPLTPPHPDITPPRGARPTPVRLLTLAGERGAKVFRAVWRLGGSEDLVASLDLKTGAVRGVAPSRAPHRSWAPPPGLAVPDWATLKAAAVEGARLFAQFGVLGWTVAPTADGPVILGVDAEPGFELCQLADRRGVLDAEFLAFLAERRRGGDEWRQTQTR